MSISLRTFSSFLIYNYINQDIYLYILLFFPEFNNILSINKKPKLSKISKYYKNNMTFIKQAVTKERVNNKRE